MLSSYLCYQECKYLQQSKGLECFIMVVFYDFDKN